MDPYSFLGQIEPYGFEALRDWIDVTYL